MLRIQKLLVPPPVEADDDDDEGVEVVIGGILFYFIVLIGREQDKRNKTRGRSFGKCERKRKVGGGGTERSGSKNPRLTTIDLCCRCRIVESDRLVAVCCLLLVVGCWLLVVGCWLCVPAGTRVYMWKMLLMLFVVCCLA